MGQAAKVWEGLSGLKPKDEAYRSFNLALAYEAIGNAETDMQQALADLQKSQMLYKKAIELKKRWKIFHGSISRIQQSIDDIPKLERMYAHQRFRHLLHTPSSASADYNGAAAPLRWNSYQSKLWWILVAAGLSESSFFKDPDDFMSFRDGCGSTGLLKKHGVSEAIIAAMMQAPVVPLPQQPAKKKITVKSSKS